MGRSTASCFKIIACGSDSVDRDDLDASETKGSDKRGWSFRKRSARHRVLSNTVITEVPSSENKESPESATVNFQAPTNSTIGEKASGTELVDEMPRLSTSMNKGATESTLVVKDTTEDDKDVNLDVSVIIVIQAAVRGFLARRALLKHKTVIKLQAAVRGHLVRRHAVGTLRCVQAIVKMQALVRAHISCKRNAVEEKGILTSETKSRPTYISIDKLLSNRFACQLLESAPRTKQINIKCDPLRSDSAWKWLERWMSVSPISPAETTESYTPELSTDLPEQDKVKHPEKEIEKANSSASDHVETVIPSENYCESTDVLSEVVEAALPSNSKENLITFEQTSSLESDNLEHSQPANTFTLDSEANFNALPNQMWNSDSTPQIELNSVSSKPESENELSKRSVKRLATEQADSEGRKFVFGSRKASNPAFISAQSKFEELASTTNSGKSISSISQDIGIDSCAESISSAPNNSIKTREVDLIEPAVHSSTLQVGGSECGTELSISSTLDSPDQSEVGNMEFEKETKVLVEEVDPQSSDNLDIDAHKLDQTVLGTELTYTISDVLEKHDSGDGADSEPYEPQIIADISPVELKLEENASNGQVELEPETVHQAYKSSPEASPRSHMTVPDSQGTPSSHVSASTKKTRSDKKGSSQKRKSWSTSSKRSPINPNLDSGLRSSLDQLHKDHKTGKRRNSFGSTGPDHVDQEPRDSSSNNSLPSYMQATESARAKLLANSSPRSSPDMQDKEIYIKKRHSLPGANGRQGSPRIQRSMSQAQQSSKRNGTHERKWQR